MIEIIVGLALAAFGGWLAYSTWRSYQRAVQRPRSRPDLTVFNLPDGRFPEHRSKPQAPRPRFQPKREGLGLGSGTASPENLKPVGLAGEKDPQPMGGVMGAGAPRPGLQPADAREKAGDPPTLGL